MMNSKGCSETFLKGVGLCTIALFGIKVLHGVWNIGLRPKVGDIKKSVGGGVAVVTGSTAGIGKECARELVKSGLDVVLVGRNAEKLKNTKTELLKESTNEGVSIDILVLDATTDAVNIERIVKKELGSKDVSILINNVGTHADNSDQKLDLDQVDLKSILMTIQINIVFTVVFTKALVSQMKRRKEHSIIINVSSMTSKVPMPYLSVYSGSKAFCDQWSISQAAALSPHNITVTCARPGLTATKMTGLEPSLGSPDPATMAKAIIYRNARVNAEVLTVPYWVHSMMDTTFSCIPYKWLFSTLRNM